MVTFARSVQSDAARGHAPDELARLEEEIAELAAYLDAAVHRLLTQLREFDRREGWGGGFASCAHWLSWRVGLDLGAAREKVRVARALERLPQLDDALRTGVVSYSKVRALTRIATPETEASLLEFALNGSAAQVERLVRAWRKVDRNEEASAERERHASRYLTLQPDGDGMYELRGRLDPEVAMALKRALESATWDLYRSPEGAEDEAAAETTPAQRRADAIGLVAERALDRNERAFHGDELDARTPVASAGPDHRLVVIHVDEDALAGDGSGGDAVLEDGTRVSAETSRRLACDAARVRMTHAADGTVVAVGRKTRAVPPALRRALDQRDGGCRFPGCGSRFCDAHHVRHWADGGETRLDNLVLLCRRHHRAVHEDGFQLAMAAGLPSFRRPDGTPLPESPESARADDDPVEVLRDRYAAAPLGAAPLCQGGRLDLDWAIAALWRRGSQEWIRESR